MTSPELKVLISAAVISAGYAFICHIRLARAAHALAKQVRQELPDLWRGTSFIARGMNGGLPALKMLFRRHRSDLAGFSQKYDQLQSMKRCLFRGLAIGGGCIAFVFIGTRFWGWVW